MATATELSTSRLGSVRGTNGAHGLATVWLVCTDADADDPADTEAVFLAGLPRLGSSFKDDTGWEGFGLVAMDYYVSPSGPPTPRDWEVHVLYKPPLVMDPSRPWEIEINVAGETEHVFVDLDGKLIGPHIYKAVPKTEDGTDDTAGIEQLKKDYPDVMLGSRFQAGGRELFQLRGTHNRRSLGLPRLKRAGTLVLSGRSDYVSDREVASLIASVTYLNRGLFFGASAAQIQFLGASIRPRLGTLTGQKIAGLVYDMRFLFAWGPDGHQPETQYDTFFDDEGDEVFVMDSQGRLVGADYRLYQLGRLGDMFPAGARSVIPTPKP